MKLLRMDLNNFALDIIIILGKEMMIRLEKC